MSDHFNDSKNQKQLLPNNSLINSFYQDSTIKYEKVLFV